MLQNMDKKKILFVTARMPFPAKEGHQLRSSGILTQLSKHYDVHLFSFKRPDDVLDASSDKDYEQYCRSVTTTPLKGGFVTKVKTLLYSILKREPVVQSKFTDSNATASFVDALNLIKPDLVHFDLLPLYGLRTHVPKHIPVILDEHNVEFHLIEQKIATENNPLMRTLYSRELKLLKPFECNSCLDAEAVLACSEADTNEIKAFGQNSTYCIPNGVSVSKFLGASEVIDKDRLVFLGGMSWFPNRLGMQWFIDDILPSLLSKRPDIVVDVIGNPEPRLEIPERLSGNINILGFVDDFRPIVKKAAIMIVPLQIGSGTRLKIVEGGAMSKCMVSTPKGAEGIELENNKSIILAESASEFATAIDQVLSSPEKLKDIGNEAFQMVSSTYDWNAIGSNLNNIYNELIHQDNESVIERAAS